MNIETGELKRFLKNPEKDDPNSGWYEVPKQLKAEAEKELGDKKSVYPLSDSLLSRWAKEIKTIETEKDRKLSRKERRKIALELNRKVR